MRDPHESIAGTGKPYTTKFQYHVWKSSQTSWVVLTATKVYPYVHCTLRQNHSHGKWGKVLVNSILKNDCHNQKKIKKGKKCKTTFIIKE